MGDEQDDTTSTTFTYNRATERALREKYPYGLGFSERVRMAINEALDPDVEIQIEVVDDDEDSEDTDS